jgi:predicted metal-dependent hydrolase
VSGIPIEVVRKDIRNLHVGVYPPAGRVRVAAPHRLTDDAVRLAIVSRLRWIRRHQAAFVGQERQSMREMVTGESHYFSGRRYRLLVEEGPGSASIVLRGIRTMVLQVLPGTSRDAREAVLHRWYRRQLREQLPPLFTKWESKAGIALADVRIRKMKTRWGSCNASAGRIWLNLELAKKAPACLEYVLVHELVHIYERRHTERFRTLMDELMPNWRLVRDELNRAPLAHEDWGY